MKGKVNNKCVAYLRYSSENQGKTSIEYQKSEVEKYCEQNSLVLMGCYVDEAYSGKNDRRPEFRMMLEDARSNPEWNTILVYELSRFTRNMFDALKYKEELRRLGIKVISIKESCTVDDPGGFHECVIDMMNEQESYRTARRARSSLASKSKKAKHCGGVPPLGYDVFEDKLVINESEAMIVKSIFEMCLAGYSYQKMADQLNSKGLQTKAGNPFTKHSFSDILRQKKYIGTYIWNRRQAKGRDGKGNNHAEKSLEEQTIIEGGCPQIIDLETFQKVAAKLAERRNGSADSKSRRHYMLGGQKIIKCKICGRHMVGHVSYSHGNQYIIYHCPNKGAHKCDNKDISADALETYVACILVDNYITPRRLSEVNALLKGSLDSDECKIERNRLQSVKKQITNIANAIAKRGMSDALDIKLQALEQEQRVLERSLEEMKIKVRKITDKNIKPLRKKLFKTLMKSNDLEVRKFIRKAIEEILVDKDDVTVVLAS